MGSLQDPTVSVARVDQPVAELLAAEQRRQQEQIALIPSENYASEAVRAANGSVLTNKYSEGYPSERYYEGNAVVDEIEVLAAARARSLFNVEHANVQPYSGSPANLAVYLAFCQPGDTVMGMSLPAGGHLTHGWKVSLSSLWFRAVHYGVRRDTGQADLDEVRALALRERPRLIFCGGTAIPRLIDFDGFAAVAKEAGALLVADIAHIAGLVAGGVHPSPSPHADVISTTTHKTLRGPRGAMLMSRAAHADAIDRAIFPGLQGGPHDHTTAAIAVALGEASSQDFRNYAEAIVSNAQALAESLLERGFKLVSGGTDNHLILVDLTNKDIGGAPAAKGLDRAGIVCNYNSVPFDPRPPRDPSGIRLGTPAAKTRGMGPGEMRQIACWIDEAVAAILKKDESALARIRSEVVGLTSLFPIPGEEAPSAPQAQVATPIAP
jgi:glycine hydroxymethyltransferase